MTILWSFSYNSCVKFHGKKILEPQHECYMQICVITRCVIKGLYCTTPKLATSGFIQASMSKIQGLFKDFSKHLQQFSRT